jgi:hypothetical protein
VLGFALVVSSTVCREQPLSVGVRIRVGLRQLPLGIGPVGFRRIGLATSLENTQVAITIVHGITVRVAG